MPTLGCTSSSASSARLVIHLNIPLVLSSCFADQPVLRAHRQLRLPAAAAPTQTLRGLSAAATTYAENVLGWGTVTSAPGVARIPAAGHLVGNVPAFDAAVLERFLPDHDLAPAWDYHRVDVAVMAVGFCAARIGCAWTEEIVCAVMTACVLLTR